MSMRLEGKSALVTGAASGFGAEIARHFAREGAKVTLMDLNGEGARAVAGEIGASAMNVKGDVTSRADIDAAIAAAVEHGEKLDILVNNAGWTHRNKPLLEVTEEEFDKVFAINVKSIFHAAHAVVPVFAGQGHGVILNIGSTAGIRPRPGLTVYNSSKGAVVLMSRSMAAEFGPDRIRVNCVNPVFSPDTALSAEFAGGEVTEEAKKRFLATIPLGRFSTPLDVANACLYLASEEASMISGVCIEVDGARCV